MRLTLNAHLLSGRADYRAAGIHGYIHGLLRALPAALPADWHATALVGAQAPADLPGLAVRRTPFSTERAPVRIAWEQLAQPFALRGADLVHALAFVAPLWPLLPPTVVTVYDLSFIHHPERLPAARRAYLQTLTPLTYRRARRVIAISQATADDLTRTLRVPPDKIDVAHPGTDTAVFRPLPADDVAAFRARAGLPPDFWLFLGTLEPRKNLPTLLHAYAKLPKAARPPLVLAGGQGWDGGEIATTIARLRLTDDVRLPGFVPTADLPLWYNAASAVLYPSVFEGFGLPVLEAMACGTPVVVADAASLPEVVAGTANLRVPPTDADAWAAALTRALDDSAWRAQATADGPPAAARFSWAATAQKTLLSYHRALTA